MGTMPVTIMMTGAKRTENDRYCSGAVASAFQQPARLPLGLDETERAVVEHDDFHRQTKLSKGEEVAHQHGKVAVA